MGTTVYPPGYTREEVIAEEIDPQYNTILKRRGKYAAVQNNASGQVFGVVFIMSGNSNNGVGIKIVDEGMGPNESECPKSILDLLTPTESQWANEWRERCRAHIARPKKTLKPGDTVEFSTEIGKSVGVSGKRFTYEGGFRFTSQSGYPIRMYKSWRRMTTWEVV